MPQTTKCAISGEYFVLRDKIISHMKSNNEYGKFFPGYMAQIPYDETWSSFYFPLSPENQKKAGFKYLPPVEKRTKEHTDTKEIPDSLSAFKEEDLQNIYWDEVSDKPFRIRKDDIQFAKRMGVPLPNSYYILRIQENFRFVPFNGELRKTQCEKCKKQIETGWPISFEGRILCEEDYLSLIH